MTELNVLKNKKIEDIMDYMDGLAIKIEGKWYIISQSSFPDGSYSDSFINEVSQEDIDKYGRRFKQPGEVNKQND